MVDPNPGGGGVWKGGVWTKEKVEYSSLTVEAMVVLRQRRSQQHRQVVVREPNAQEGKNTAVLPRPIWDSLLSVQTCA